jgi:raffinose/stachyose/melibiose transport system permease protein
LFWTLMSSLKDTTEIVMNTTKLPTRLVFENYVKAWGGGDMFRFYWNTISVALSSTIVTLLIAAMATYVLARVLNVFPLYAYFVSGLFIPVYIIMFPILRIMSALTLNNSLVGLALIYIIVMIPQSFFVLYGYMKMVPGELEEAATIDGCSRSGTFIKVILPVAKPGLATVGIFALLHGWNEYLLPLVLVNGNQKMVLSQAIRAFQLDFSTEYGPMTARMIMSIVPVFIIYVLFQKYVIKGMTAGAVKG